MAIVLPRTLEDILSAHAEEEQESISSLAQRYIASGLERDGVVITQQQNADIGGELDQMRKEREQLQREAWDDIAGLELGE